MDVESNRQAVKYSRKELLARLAWGVGRLAFRYSPRVAFGWRRGLLRCFGARIGQGVHIYNSASIYFPWKLSVGAYSAIGEYAYIYNLGSVVIGERATVSYRAHICAGTHDYLQAEFPLIKTTVQIGDRAWIGTDAFIGPAAFIADDVIVAARAVVVAHTEAGMIYGGNPAKVIKARSTNSTDLQPS